MRRSIAISFVNMICGLLIFACAPGSTEPVGVITQLPDEAVALATSFAPAAEILDGFDDMDASGDWRVGDRVLFGLRIDHGDESTVRFIVVELGSGVLSSDADVVIRRPDAGGGDPTWLANDDPTEKTTVITLTEQDSEELVGRLPARRWSMHMTFTDDKSDRAEHITRESQPVFVAVHLFDEAGRRLRSSGALAPEAYLRTGFYAACVAAEGRSSEGPLDRATVIRVLGDFFPSLYAIGETISNTPNLRAIVSLVVPGPSLWSLLWHGGIECSVDFPVRSGPSGVLVEDRPLDALRSGLRAYRFPAEVAINGEPALRCFFSVVPPEPPFHLSAGIIAVDGVQARDPTKRFTLRLLAARRG